MLARFPANPALAPLGAKMASVAQALSSAQTAYADAVKAILPTRVDVKYENFASDRRIRLSQQKAEMADGKKGGAFAAQAFPEGSSPIVRLVGPSQVKAMSDLAGRLAALTTVWPEASAEAQATTHCRDDYDAAVKGRDSAGQTSTNLRALRDVAKESFLTAYAEITSRICVGASRAPGTAQVALAHATSGPRSAATARTFVSPTPHGDGATLR